MYRRVEDTASIFRRIPRTLPLIQNIAILLSPFFFSRRKGSLSCFYYRSAIATAAILDLCQCLCLGKTKKNLEKDILTLLSQIKRNQGKRDSKTKFIAYHNNT